MSDPANVTVPERLPNSVVLRLTLAVWPELADAAPWIKARHMGEVRDVLEYGLSPKTISHVERAAIVAAAAQLGNGQPIRFMNPSVPPTLVVIPPMVERRSPEEREAMLVNARAASVESKPAEGNVARFAGPGHIPDGDPRAGSREMGGECR